MNSFTEDNNQSPLLLQNLELLKEVPFFSTFPGKAMKLIAFLAERDSFVQHDHLFEEGDDNGKAYLVLSGQLLLYKRHDEGDREVRRYSEGDFLCSLSLLGSMPSLFMLKAQTEATVLTIKRKQFAQIFQQFPETLNLALKATLEGLYQWERKNMHGAEKCCFDRSGATAL